MFEAIEIGKLAALLFIAYQLGKILQEMYVARLDRGYRLALRLKQREHELEAVDREGSELG